MSCEQKEKKNNEIVDQFVPNINKDGKMDLVLFLLSTKKKAKPD